ncbi:MAG: hypothetical protein Tsb0018_06610 [Opitutales bacterium]|tara:strand:+ start:172 stop:2403 length:2232 start_codon:yes stop_codon:yes gene_type:complete
MHNLIKKTYIAFAAIVFAGSSITYAKGVDGVLELHSIDNSSQVLNCILNKDHNHLEHWLKEGFFDPNTLIEIHGTLWSLLHIAMLNDDPIATQLLIDYGADPWAIKNIDGIIYVLAEEARLDILKLLHKHDPALLNVQFLKKDEDNGSSILCVASRSKHESAFELVQWLLTLGFDPNQRCNAYEINPTEKAACTALSGALIYERHDIVRLLMEHGASVQQAGIYNELAANPLAIAAVTGQTDIMQELIERGADIQQAIFNRTPTDTKTAHEIIDETLIASQWGAFEILWNAGARPSLQTTWTMALKATLTGELSITSDEVIEAYTAINEKSKKQFLKRSLFDAINGADIVLVAFCLGSIHPNEIVNEEVNPAIDFYMIAVVNRDPVILRLFEIYGGIPLSWFNLNGGTMTHVLKNYVLYSNYLKQHPFEGVLAPICSIGGFIGSYYLAGQYLPAWMEGDVNGAIVEAAFAMASPAEELQDKLPGLESAVSEAKNAWDASKNALKEISKNIPLEKSELKMNAAQLAQTVSERIQGAIGNSGKMNIARIQLMNAGAPTKWNAFKTWADELFGEIIETTCNDSLGELRSIASFMDPTKTQAYKAIAQYLQDNNIWKAPFNVPNPMIPGQLVNPAWNEAHAAAEAAKATWNRAKESLASQQREIAQVVKKAEKTQKRVAYQQTEASQATQESFRRKMARAGIGIAAAYPSYRVCEYLGSYLDELAWGPNKQDALLAQLVQIIEANAE